MCYSIHNLKSDFKEKIMLNSTKDANWRENALAAVAFAVIAFAALLIVRFALFYYESYDYIHSLSRWIEQYRQMSFFEGLGTRVGNYNPPYMYCLNIIARINASDMYLIKILSVVFDVLLAYFAMKLVLLKTKSMNMQLLAFLLAFAMPTVILNSSMWGQCDSIFAAFALGSIYFALSSRSKAAYVFIALALSFKLQAAFILPVFPFFILTKKIKFSDCYIFFVVFLAMLFPAFIAGYPLPDLFLIYFNQANTYDYLTLNAVNVWQFFQNVEFEPFRMVGLYVGGTAVLSLMYFTFVHRQRLNVNVDFIRLAFLSGIFIPFLLPQMHDRFFYIPDMLAVILFLYDKRRWYIPLICVFCSFISYAWLIMEYVHLVDYRLAALALTAAIFIVLRDYVISLTSKEQVGQGSVSHNQ